MRTFDEIVHRVFDEEVDGRYVFEFGEADFGCRPRYSLELEPILGGGYLIALYEHDEGGEFGDPPGGSELLLSDKVPVRPILREQRP